MQIHNVLQEVLAAAAVTTTGITESVVAGQAILNVEMEEPSAWIGSHGDTVRALDTIVKRITEKKNHKEEASGEHLPLVDVAGYRTKLIHDLQEKARVMAERAKSLKYDVEMHPMTAYERLIVHSTLQGVEGIKTSSTGEGRDRRVVIQYIF